VARRVCKSNRRNIRLVDSRQVLEKVCKLPIKQGSDKSQDPSVEHIGPIAQDFHALFPLGDDSLTISTVDPSGIALAAIQELKHENDQLRQELNDLRTEIRTLITISKNDAKVRN
jgi:hypothetical protein